MSLDLSVAEHANHFAARHDLWEDVASVYASASEALFAGLVGLLLVVGVVAHRRRLAWSGALAGAAAALALTVTATLAAVVARPRPFVAHSDITSFIPHAADPGFPSDHAGAAFAIAVLLVLRLGRPAVLVLLAALALAVSRVLVGVHYPSDVITGALVGSLAAVAVHHADRLRMGGRFRMRTSAPTG